MPLIDYYAILEVAPTATLEQIKRSYRRLARQHHPDLNHQANDERIKQLNEAYAVLSDRVKRTAYDIRRLEEARNRIIIDLIRKQQGAQRAARMTWPEGIAGFFREFKRNLRD